MRRTFRRTLIVEFALTDKSSQEEGDQFDGLADCSVAEIIERERKLTLSEWFGITNVTLRSDEMTEAPADDPPEYGPDDAEAQRIAEACADANTEHDRIEQEDRRA